MFTILSIFSRPLIDLYESAVFSALYILLCKTGNNVSLIRVDFPLPETPVMIVRVFKGIFKSIFFKLFPVHPFNSINFPLPGL